MEAVENVEETVPESSPRLAGMPNWGTATVAGIFAGMLYGGSKEASASVSKDAKVMLKMGSTHDKREQHRLCRSRAEHIDIPRPTPEKSRPISRFIPEAANGDGRTKRSHGMRTSLATRKTRSDFEEASLPFETANLESPIGFEGPA